MTISSDSDEYQQLAQLIPLNTLKEEAFEALIPYAQIQQIGKNEVIFNEGDVDHVNVYLLSGKVKLLTRNIEIDEVTDDGPAARFPVAHQIPRKYTAKTSTKSIIVKIDSRRLSEALADNEEPQVIEVEHVNEEQDSDWMTQLLQSRVMQHIPASNLQGVMMRMKEKQVAAGDIIIYEGDEGDYFYLLHRGEADVLILDKETGENNKVAVLKAGAAFGEDALLSNRPRSSTIKMNTDGILLCLSKEDFIELIKHPLSSAVNYEQAQAIIDKGGIWVDVRDHDSYEADHLPGSINLPHASLRFQIDSLDAEREYVIYSQTGTRALSSAYLFVEHGLQASTLQGGYDAINGELEKKAQSSSAEEHTRVSQDELTKLQKELAELKVLLTEKDQALSAAGETEQQLRQKLETSKTDSVDPKQIQQLENKNKKLEREMIGLTEQLESQEDSYDRLKQQFDKQEQEHKKHLNLRDIQIGEVKEQLTVLQLERDEAVNELDALHASKDTSKTNDDDPRLKQALNQIEQLEAVNSAITNERDNQKYELEELRNRLSLVNQEISELQLEISDLKGRLSESEQELPTGTSNS